MLAISPHTATHPLAPRREPVPVSALTYRRRRLAAAALLVLLVLSLVSLVGRLGGAAGTADAELDLRPVAELSVLVQPGDTVWSIAESLAGDGDIRPIVDAITEANGGADLVAGQRLTLHLP